MKYKMTIIPALEAGKEAIVFTFETAEQMICAKNTAAELLLFLQKRPHVMKDYSNLFFLEERVNGEWEEYEEF